jgi:hypothetical protein
MFAIETLSQRVERARADVPVDDPEACEAEQEKATFAAALPGQSRPGPRRIRKGGN